jgi:hypothetical protein
VMSQKKRNEREIRRTEKEKERFIGEREDFRKHWRYLQSMISNHVFRVSTLTLYLLKQKYDITNVTPTMI